MTRPPGHRSTVPSVLPDVVTRLASSCPETNSMSQTMSTIQSAYITPPPGKQSTVVSFLRACITRPTSLCPEGNCLSRTVTTKLAYTTPPPAQPSTASSFRRPRATSTSAASHCSEEICLSSTGVT